MKISVKFKYLAIVVTRDNIHKWFYLSDFWLKVKKIFSLKRKYIDITLIQTGEKEYKIKKTHSYYDWKYN
jgi:hypothetical protein